MANQFTAEDFRQLAIRAQIDPDSIPLDGQFWARLFESLYAFQSAADAHASEMERIGKLKDALKLYEGPAAIVRALDH